MVLMIFIFVVQRILPELCTYRTEMAISKNQMKPWLKRTKYVKTLIVLFLMQMVMVIWIYTWLAEVINFRLVHQHWRIVCTYTMAKDTLPNQIRFYPPENMRALPV